MNRLEFYRNAGIPRMYITCIYGNCKQISQKHGRHWTTDGKRKYNQVPMFVHSVANLFKLAGSNALVQLVQRPGGCASVAAPSMDMVRWIKAGIMLGQDGADLGSSDVQQIPYPKPGIHPVPYYSSKRTSINLSRLIGDQGVPEGISKNFHTILSQLAWSPAGPWDTAEAVTASLHHADQPWRGSVHWFGTFQ